MENKEVEKPREKQKPSLVDLFQKAIIEGDNSILEDFGLEPDREKIIRHVLGTLVTQLVLYSSLLEKEKRKEGTNGDREEIERKIDKIRGDLGKVKELALGHNISEEVGKIWEGEDYGNKSGLGDDFFTRKVD